MLSRPARIKHPLGAGGRARRIRNRNERDYYPRSARIKKDFSFTTGRILIVLKRRIKAERARSVFQKVRH